MVGVVVQFILAWLCGNLLCRDKSKQSAFAHACFRGNFAYLGMALLQNIYNSDTVASTAVILAVVLPLYNIQGVILMTIKEGEGGIHIGKILLGVLKNPMVLAILAGLPFAYFQVELPYVASKSLSYLQVATSTMAPSGGGRQHQAGRHPGGSGPFAAGIGHQAAGHAGHLGRDGRGGGAERRADRHADHRGLHACRRQCVYHHRQAGRQWKDRPAAPWW